MKHSKRLVYFLSSFLILASLYSPSLVSAQESRSFSISPPNFEISGNQGDVIKNTIKVENLSDSKLSLKVRAENFVAYGDGGQVNLTEENTTYSINKWMNFSKTEFAIDAHKSYLFDFTIQIPQTAEAGSHYGAVVFSNDDQSNQAGSVAKVVQEIGALVLIKLPGNVDENASLLSFAPETQVFQKPDIKLNALVKNTGGVHYKMSSYIYIYDILGNKIKTIEAKSLNILPGSERLFDQEFSFENFGYYRADIEMFYSNGAKVVRGNTNFVSLNLDRSLPIAGIVILITLIYIILRKRINKAIKIIIKG